MKRISMLYLPLLLGTSLVYSQPGQTLSPQEIRDKMVSVYASCSSYVDQGQVETTFFSQSGLRTSSRRFSTAFVRPSRFRFEFVEIGLSGRESHYIVWRDESAIKSWGTIKPETRDFETLALALAGGGGVSGGSAIFVPSMLMGNLGDLHRIQTMTQLKLKREERIEDKTAYRIEGRDWQNNLLTIWIDKESFLLLRILEKKTVQDFQMEQTTTYQPQINTNISPEKLAFNH
jgi:outer membrane lipoprotein-sorting protein